MDVDTLYTEGNVFGLPVLGYREQSYTIIADGETADTEFRDDHPDGSDFAEETNFEESYILVAQYGTRSEEDLVLDSIERIESGLRVAISVDKPFLIDHDDLKTHSYLIRITDKEGVPDSVDLTIAE
ncbi:hypothetical protein EA462_11840 [Natrarchaeobius halalkaliphilus]|uniref:Uncharacterized protein n=2 Tax=Natrarchaeobius halalkaliphilus TaxID=1679091 RepID=A0A3N6LJW3_9EURY|nr:hypothetical protein EA462_11840 [Natrarchaeobius halalkaliphilus]